MVRKHRRKWNWNARNHKKRKGDLNKFRRMQE